MKTIRSIYGDEKVRPVVITGKKSDGKGAKQQFKDETNINKIMDRYNKTGVLPELIKKDPRYGDFSLVPDYRESLDKVLFAEAQFNALPAKVRDRFQNDPAAFIEFATSEANRDELKLMGLLKNDELNDDKINPPAAPNPTAEPSNGNA